ncbi:NHLP leader peptide family RiPP precursor [Paenibacillus sp. SI8]|uniref:NHLP leader peptide family RiPP precursor n=1 Tax=unclassified Paenibacillus TaxID=185978 RepID=UPI0034667E74
MMSAEEILKEKIIQKAWEDESFKKQLLSDPKAALKESFDIVIPDNIKIKTVEETTEQLVLVIPANPKVALDGSVRTLGEW